MNRKCRPALDFRPGFFQHRDGGLQRRTNSIVDGHINVVEQDGNAKVLEFLLPRSRQIQIPRNRLMPIRAGQNIEQQIQIARCSRQRTGDGQIRSSKRARRTGNMAAQRDQTVTRLMAVDAAKMCRRTNRAADIAAEFKRRHPCSNGRRCTAGRTTGRAT